MFATPICRLDRPDALKGLLVEVISIAHMDSRRTADMPHKHASRFDTLDEVFGVYRSPANGTTRLKPIHRRVDLIVVDWHHWPTAIMGWTGSTQFERDLRSIART